MEFPRSLLLIEAVPHSGSWNMAVDEALLEAAREKGVTAVRFYRWQEPTLSLGYFQKQLPADLPDQLNRLPAVRRLSGGGAILHHQEWTYSCVLPPNHLLTDEPTQLYEIVHNQIIGWLAEQGISTRLRGTPQPESEEPFLCFGRQDPRDIVLGSDKIVGSAQRRRRGAILQHGSLLFQRSPFAPMYPGLRDLSEKDFPGDSDIPELADRISRELQGDQHSEWQSIEQLPEDMLMMAQDLEQGKYLKAIWR